MSKFTILSQESFDDYAEIVLFSNAATYERKVLNCYDVFFTIIDNETQETYNLTYQSLERNNGLMCYAGYEMDAGIRYGYDADESLNFLSDYEDTKFEQEANDMYKKCLTLAEDSAQDYLLSHI